ncbi:MAG TPA: glucosyl-3-phosphoglycerate synthase [Acidimicrobiales bacterium]|nr:glucosyl-3-phosphoglycerate synthase [Acidimicrobiales bacterium]
MTSVRSHHHLEFPLAELIDAKAGLTVSVVMPARDEAETVAGIVTCLRAQLVPAGLVDEVIVVDDGSTDGTAAVAAAAGARVVTAGTLLEDEGWGPGKGRAMWEGLYAASGDLVVFLDADVTNFGSHFVAGLLGPLLADPEVALVKAFYARPLGGAPGEGGRVTELTARPLLSVLFPHLASVVQPLAGECAGRREVLERVPFAHGYGVELGLLVDVSALVGTGALAQVDLGTRVHRNRPLAELSGQATAVLCAALQRAGLDVAPDHAVLERPGGEMVVVRTGTHPPLAELRGELRTA